MKSGYNIVAETADDGSLVCKGCKDKYCVTVKDRESHFCPSYRGSIFDGKLNIFLVKCEEYGKD